MRRSLFPGAVDSYLLPGTNNLGQASDPPTLEEVADAVHNIQTALGANIIRARRYFSPADYGAIGSNAPGADDGPAFRAAIAAAAAAHGHLEIEQPPTAYRFETPVTISSNYFKWRQSLDVQITTPLTTGPALIFAGGSQVMSHLSVDGLRIDRVFADAHRVPLVQFGDANSLAYANVRDVHMTGGNLKGDGIWLHTVLNSTFAGVYQENIPGMSGVMRAASNVGNIHFDSWTTNAAGIMFLIQEAYGAAFSSVLINSLKFTNAKAAPGPGYRTNKFFASAVDAAGAAQFATVIPLTPGDGAASGVAAGDWIVAINSNNHVYADEVLSVSTDAITLRNSAGIPLALVAGNPIIIGSWNTVIGTSTENIIWDVPHCERVNGVLASGSISGLINNPEVTPTTYRALCAARAQNYKIVSPRGSTAMPSTGVVLHQMNSGFNQGNAVEGANSTLIGANAALLKVDGGAVVGASNRYLAGTEQLLGVWKQETTIPISQTNVQLSGPNTLANNRSLRMRSYGTIVSVVAQVRNVRTGGTLTATVYKNGSATALTAVLDGSLTTPNSWFYRITDATTALTFVPGDTIDVRVTTDGSWAPTATDLDVSVYVAQ